MSSKKDDVGDLGEMLKPHFVLITLTEEEMNKGEYYGKKVWLENQKVGRCDERSSEEAEIAWVRSEIAVARWIGIPYEDPCNKFNKVPDVGFADVKWTEDLENGLLVRRNQRNNRAIISTAGKAPDVTLRGWEFSQHIKKWGQDLASRQKREGSIYDGDGKLNFPWRQLKPMYLLSRNLIDYAICQGCDGSGINSKLKCCDFCELGRMLSENPVAFAQMMRLIK